MDLFRDSRRLIDKWDERMTQLQHPIYQCREDWQSSPCDASNLSISYPRTFIQPTFRSCCPTCFHSHSKPIMIPQFILFFNIFLLSLSGWFSKVCFTMFVKVLSIHSHSGTLSFQNNSRVFVSEFNTTQSVFFYYFVQSTKCHHFVRQIHIVFE